MTPRGIHPTELLPMELLDTIAGESNDVTVERDLVMSGMALSTGTPLPDHLLHSVGILDPPFFKKPNQESPSPEDRLSSGDTPEQAVDSSLLEDADTDEASSGLVAWPRPSIKENAFLCCKSIHPGIVRTVLISQ